MKLFHELITEYAAAFPDKAAAVDPRGEISYGEMERLSYGFSRVLAALGTETGDAVAVYVPYTGEILLGAVSALRAGAVFIPFDCEYPVERLTFMLEDAHNHTLTMILPIPRKGIFLLPRHLKTVKCRGLFVLDAKRNINSGFVRNSDIVDYRDSHIVLFIDGQFVPMR